MNVSKIIMLFVVFCLLFSNCKGMNDSVESCVNVCDSIFCEDDYSCIVALYKEPDSVGWKFVDRDTLYSFYNLDKSFYCKFNRDTTSVIEDGEPYCQELANKIVGYYPYYGLFYLFCKNYDDKYLGVRIGEQWKLLRKTQPHYLVKTEEFLKQLDYVPEKTDSVFANDRITRIELPTEYRGQEFKIMSVDGEWIQIAYNSHCYWIKWRNKYTVLEGRIRYF